MADNVHNKSDNRDVKGEETPTNPIVSGIGSVFVLSLMTTIACAIIYFVPQIAFPIDHPIHAYGSEPIWVSPLKNNSGPVDPQPEEQEPPSDSGSENQDLNEVDWGGKLSEVIQWWVDRYYEWFGMRL